MYYGNRNILIISSRKIIVLVSMNDIGNGVHEKLEGQINWS